MKTDISKFFRASLLKLNPYKSAREEYLSEGRDMILIDANENPFQSSTNRYPDPLQGELKQKISKWKNVNPNQLYLSNGSDEFITQIIMACCEPGRDEIMIVPPTFGMYKVSAQILGVGIIEVPLKPGFKLNTKAIIDSAKENTKLIFIPTPNNPTANNFDPIEIKKIIKSFNGIVVIDEAYIEFSNHESFTKLLEYYPNLAVCQTFSKAQGMAGARLGMAFANSDLINYLNKFKAPYNLNSLTISAALKRINEQVLVKNQVKIILRERKKLEISLRKIKFVESVFPSDANFILIRVDNSLKRYKQLLNYGIVVRNSSKNIFCENTLRITVGLKDENEKLLFVMKKMENL